MHVTNKVTVWHNYVTLWPHVVRCVLIHGFRGWEMEWDWPIQYAYWMQRKLMTHIAHLFRCSNSSQITCKIEQICVKSFPFLKPNSEKLVRYNSHAGRAWLSRTAMGKNVLLCDAIEHRVSSVHASNWAHPYIKTYSQRLHDLLSQNGNPCLKGDNGLKIHQKLK